MIYMICKQINAHHAAKIWHIYKAMGWQAAAVDDKFCDIFPNFSKKNKVWYFMRIICQQKIFMKYHALFVIFEKAAKFENVVCCKL